MDVVVLRRRFGLDNNFVFRIGLFRLTDNLLFDNSLFLIYFVIFFWLMLSLLVGPIVKLHFLVHFPVALHEHREVFFDVLFELIGSHSFSVEQVVEVKTFVLEGSWGLFLGLRFLATVIVANVVTKLD